MHNLMILFRTFICILFLLIATSCNNSHSKRVKIGAVLPITGKMANYGKSSQAALQAMLMVINKERERKKYPLLELIIEDDQMEVKGGISAVNKLIQKDKVPVIIGPDASSITLGVAPIAETNKTVIVSPGSTSSDVTKAGDYIFRTIPSGEYESKISYYLYNELYPNEKLAIMYINNEFGISLKNNFIKNFGNTSNVIEISYDEKVVNFSSYLAKIKSAGIKVIYLIGYNEMIQIYQQAAKMNLNVKWLGTAQVDSQSLVDKIGSSVEGVIFPSLDINIAVIKENNPDFYNEFLRLSGGLELDTFAANAVDALKVLDSVIGSDIDITSEKIKNELYKVSNFNGITGTFSFDANGDVNKTITVKTVKNGKIIKLNK